MKLLKSRKGGMGSTELDRIIWEDTVVEYRDERRKKFIIYMIIMVAILVVVGEKSGFHDWLISLI